MGVFFDIVGFEYKKILKRKSTLVSLSMILIAIAFIDIRSITSTSYRNSDADVSIVSVMQKDRKVVQSKAGLMDEALIKEAIEQNARLIENEENYYKTEYGKYIKEDAYIRYILPYKNVIYLINGAFEKNIENLSTDGVKIINTSNVQPIDTLTEKDSKSFYTRMNQATINHINRLPFLTQDEKQMHFDMLSQVNIPYYNDYNDGYLNILMNMEVIALISMIAISICISPIFANEYYLKTDQIILSSKYGKNKVIKAKLFAGITFTVGVSAITMCVFLLSILLIHGCNGANMAIQTIEIFSTYPFTLLQACIIATVVVLFIILFYGMITMIFSTLFHSPFLVIIVSFLILFLPGLFKISNKNRFLYQMYQLLPVRATQFSNIFSVYLFEIFGVVLTPVSFYIIFAIIGTVLAIPVSKHIFKNHQIES